MLYIVLKAYRFSYNAPQVIAWERIRSKLGGIFLLLPGDQWNMMKVVHKKWIFLSILHQFSFSNHEERNTYSTHFPCQAAVLCPHTLLYCYTSLSSLSSHLQPLSFAWCNLMFPLNPPHAPPILFLCLAEGSCNRTMLSCLVCALG